MAESFPGQTGEYVPTPVIAIHDAIQASFGEPENTAVSLAAQRQQLADIVFAAERFQNTPEAQSAIREYAAVVDYLWFQPSDAPLPAALAFIDAGVREEHMRIELDESRITYERFDQITGLLEEFGLEQLLRTRLLNQQRNMGALTVAYNRALRDTPTGKWFDAFAFQNDGLMQPLTPLERLPLEVALYDHTRRNAGTAAHDPRRLHYNGRRAYQRHEAQLDEEQSRTTRSTDSHRRAMSAMRRLASSAINQFTVRPDLVAEARYDEEGGAVRLYGKDGKPVKAAIDPRFGEFMSTFHDTVDLGMYMADEIGIPFAGTHNFDLFSRELFVNVFDLTLSGITSYTELRDKALAETAESFLSMYQRGLILESSGMLCEVLSFMKLPPRGPRPGEWVRRSRLKLFGRAQPSGGKETETLFQVPPKGRGRQAVQHPTRKEYNRHRRTVIGRVLHREPPFDGIRLIESHLIDPTLPKERRGSSSQLTLKLAAGLDWDPRVTAYNIRTADRDEGIYTFSYNELGEPYLRHERLLSPSAVGELAETYRTLGLRKLSQFLLKQDGVTVSGLVDAISSHASYAYRKWFNRGSLTPQRLPDFRGYVWRGKLRTTCDVAAAFCALSLLTAVPDCEVRRVSGLTIRPNSPDISLAEHTQLEYKDAHLKYPIYIECSPGVPRGFFALLKRDAQNASEAPPTETGTLSPPRDTERLPNAEDVKQRLSLSVGELMLQLRTMLNPHAQSRVPDEHVYRQLRQHFGREGHTHPVIRTLSALLVAQDYIEQTGTLRQSDKDALAGAYQHIRGMQQPPPTPRRASAASYTPDDPLLEALRAALDPLVTLLGLPRGEGNL
jgi:hypothetical protein